MKKIFTWAKKHLDLVGLTLHSIWLGVGIGLGFTETQQLAGHAIIGNATGVGLFRRYKRNKEGVDKAIKSATDVFRKKKE